MSTRVITRKIDLNDFVKILKDTAEESVPTIQVISEMLEDIGEEFDFEPARVISEGLETVIRMTVQALDMSHRDGIGIKDNNGSRRIKDQVLAVKAFKRIRDHG